MNKHDVIEVHSSVLNKLKEDAKHIKKYEKIVSQLNVLLKSCSDMKEVQHEVINSINHYTTQINYLKNVHLFYIMKTSELIESHNMNNQDISKLYKTIKEYIETDSINSPSQNVNIRIVCSICKGDCFDVKDGTTYTCRSCGNQKDLPNISPMYKDTSRIMTSLRYTYKRKIHFKDCINQYQGKQNVNIDENVILQIKNSIHLHKLNDGINYSRVTKEHILMFLKDTNNAKHYEDINLIYKIITGKHVDDIGYLEETLMNDFSALSDLYDKKFKQTNRIERKSFINTQYVLFQLLKRHNHICNKEDFNILKTVDRRTLHEEIITELFDELGWNYTSLF